MVTAYFDSEKYTYKTVTGLWQYDYGQVLRIQGLNIPPAVEIHFSLAESGAIAERRIGITKDGVTDVIIPDSMLENGDTDMDYQIFAFVYVSDTESGETVHKIRMNVKSRPKPEAWSGSGETTSGQIMEAVNQIAAGKADGLEYKDSILKLLSGEKEIARVTIKGGSGSGTDAREIELQKGTTAIQWRYAGDQEWIDLISLEEITGTDGKSAYQVALDNGFAGTETEWLTSLKGADGYTPKKGTDYFDGTNGKSAYQYAQEGGYTGTEVEFAVLIGDTLPGLKSDLSSHLENHPSGGTASFPEGGTAGQVLKKTDGGVEWANDEIGNVTDEQVSSSVNSWLDLHPEATTTVQNGTITKEKLGADVADFVYGYNPNWKYEPDEIEEVVFYPNDFQPCSTNSPYESVDNENLSSAFIETDRFPQAIEWYSGSDSISIEMISAPAVSVDNGMSYNSAGYMNSLIYQQDSTTYKITKHNMEIPTSQFNLIDSFTNSRARFYTYTNGKLTAETLNDIYSGVDPIYKWRFPFKLGQTVKNFRNSDGFVKLIYFTPNKNKWGMLEDGKDVSVTYMYNGIINTQSESAGKNLYAIVPAYRGKTYRWTNNPSYVYRYNDDGTKYEYHYGAVLLTNNPYVLTRQYPYISSGGIKSDKCYPDLSMQLADVCRYDTSDRINYCEYTVPDDCPFNYLMFAVGITNSISSLYNFSEVQDADPIHDYNDVIQNGGAYQFLNKAYVTLLDWVEKDRPYNQASTARCDPHDVKYDQGTYLASLMTCTPLHNANIVMFGDSITDSYGGHYLYDSAKEGYGFMTKIAQEFGAYFTNMAKSGTNFQRTSGGIYKNLDGCDMVDNYIADITHEAPDYCLFMFGANCHASQIGDITSTDDKVLYGAVKYCIDAIRNAYPNCIVAVILQYPIDDWNNGNKTPHAAHEAIKELITSAEYDYRVPYLDLYQYNIRSVDLRDGVHPDVTGVNKLYHAIRGFLITL